MKLTKAQKTKLASKLRHITGECDCSPSSKTCLYWTLVDKGSEGIVKAIISEIEKL